MKFQKSAIIESSNIKCVVYTSDPDVMRYKNIVLKTYFSSYQYSLVSETYLAF